MKQEYLLFDAVVGLPPLATALASRYRARVPAMLAACTAMAVPFVLWDAAVVGRHWTFEPARVLDLRVLGLPLEELGFFWAVPFACLFLWEAVFRGASARPGPAVRARPVWVAVLAALAAAALFRGAEYAALALLALGLAIALDGALETRLCAMPRYGLFLAAVTALNAVFNGFLTGRPIVLYVGARMLGPRVGTVPLEDFIYGAALVIGASALYARMLGRVWPAPAALIDASAPPRHASP